MKPINHTIDLEIDIGAEPGKVFDSVIDVGNYNTWLPHSDVFGGESQISEHPSEKGTKYEEHSKYGVRRGEIVELDSEARRVLFHQPHTLYPEILGLVIDVEVEMSVEEAAAEESSNGACVSRLKRQIRLEVPYHLNIAGGLIEKQFRVESWRTMQRLKEHLEGGKA